MPWAMFCQEDKCTTDKSIIYILKEQINNKETGNIKNRIQITNWIVSIDLKKYRSSVWPSLQWK